MGLQKTNLLNSDDASKRHRWGKNKLASYWRNDTGSGFSWKTQLRLHSYFKSSLRLWPESFPAPVHHRYLLSVWKITLREVAMPNALFKYYMV